MSPLSVRSASFEISQYFWTLPRSCRCDILSFKKRNQTRIGLSSPYPFIDGSDLCQFRHFPGWPTVRQRFCLHSPLWPLQRQWSVSVPSPPVNHIRCLSDHEHQFLTRIQKDRRISEFRNYRLSKKLRKGKIVREVKIMPFDSGSKMSALTRQNVSVNPIKELLTGLCSTMLRTKWRMIMIMIAFGKMERVERTQTDESTTPRPYGIAW
jgi:hypothetical protein